jgi:hypothetical protein
MLGFSKYKRHPDPRLLKDLKYVSIDKKTRTEGYLYIFTTERSQTSPKPHCKGKFV